jgi:hypothetical protein
MLRAVARKLRRTEWRVRRDSIRSRSRLPLVATRPQRLSVCGAMGATNTTAPAPLDLYDHVRHPAAPRSIAAAA